MALPSPTATTAERERLLALARRLEEGLEEIDKGIVLREQSLAEIADDTGASESDRVKASSAILSSQAKRADRLTSELSATRRALRPLPTEGAPETVRALAVAGKAQVLVSGDRDLLAIAAEFEQASGCPILTLDAFCKAYCDV